MATRDSLLTEINQFEVRASTNRQLVADLQRVLSQGVRDLSNSNIIYFQGKTYEAEVQSNQLQTALAAQEEIQLQIKTLTAKIPLASMQEPQTLSKPDPKVTVKTYQHAKKIFVDGSYRLSPKYGFMYYVEFDFNPLITNVSNTSAQEMGMIVKTVTLPKFTIGTKIHNAYNRKNIVQNKIDYDPVSITFHDDQADNVRNFWYDYYSYYYRDPDYADVTYNAPHKYQSRASFDWGYSPRPAVGYASSNSNQPYQYIQAIRIYSLYQGQFSEYQLINPIITRFAHGEHSAAETTGLLQHEMTVSYETVKYLNGYTTRDTVGGFIDLHYDNSPSPLGGVGSRSDNIVDLADNNTAVNRNMMSEFVLKRPALSTESYTSSALKQMTSTSAQTPINVGGMSIPSLGSLTQGLTTTAILNQRLIASGVGLATSATSTLANGVIGGITKGLGPNGMAIVSLAAAAAANPKAVLSTVENMAIQYAIGRASNWVNQQVTNLADTAYNKISGYIADSVVKPLSESFNVFTAANFSGSAWGTDLQFFTGTGIFSSGFVNPQLALDTARAAAAGVNLTDYLSGNYEGAAGLLE